MSDGAGIAKEERLHIGRDKPSAYPILSLHIYLTVYLSPRRVISSPYRLFSTRKGFIRYLRHCLFFSVADDRKDTQVTDTFGGISRLNCF
ncbi:hypothetical protein TNIN_181201 [Trichonephila inaurata madagascariensis]|uniref:Uncharacterized protein n=1 Tax=Trichonephila inaurata madagascariensis TaxID=2747483 RepID=A0A8X6XY89_9ARAC|nr:hypothetical protein TNIN_181201 [Trichonephila inaurata madagascariensis]